MGDEKTKYPPNEPRFVEQSPRPDWERFQPLVDLDNSLLTSGKKGQQGMREFLLAAEDPTKNNRVKRSRIRKRFQRGLLDIALLARHLSPEEFQKAISTDSKAPDGFDMADVREGLKAGVMFAAEATDNELELENMLESALYHAIHRRGDSSVHRVDIEIKVNRGDLWG